MGQQIGRTHLVDGLCVDHPSTSVGEALSLDEHVVSRTRRTRPNARNDCQNARIGSSFRFHDRPLVKTNGITAPIVAHRHFPRNPRVYGQNS
jgi:hypothetical protein